MPPYRLDLYGKFTINIGVYVPHLALRLGRAPRGAWVNEYNCQLRQRIGQFLTPWVSDTCSRSRADITARFTAHDSRVVPPCGTHLRWNEVTTVSARPCTGNIRLSPAGGEG